MSSWHPSDLVSDVDLLDYERAILSQFGAESWQGRRTKALEDWLFPILKGQGLDPFRLRTRAQADTVFSYISSTYADITGATQDETEADVDLAAAFATVGTDVLFLGSVKPFRGAFFRILEDVSTVASILSVAYWGGSWAGVPVNDETRKTAGKTFSGGGSVTWTLPVDWTTRTINGSAARYWVKLTVSVTPTGAKATQIGVVRSSALRAPVTFRTLALIFREAPTGSDGPWQEKAEYYQAEADAALQRALPIVGGEFDTDDDDLIDSDEDDQTLEEVGGGWKMERA
jgi:hypothetical protein